MASGLENTGASQPTAGTLFVVGTPIGNREDITLRALRILREVAAVVAENVRHTRALLRGYEIDTPVLSYREANRDQIIPQLLERLEHSSLALVSDAGMPVISDPGNTLIARVLEVGGRVEVVPGPNAAITALVGSGLAGGPFCFIGFLSRQRGDRLNQLRQLASRTEILLFYEAPHRLIETLIDLHATLGDRQIAVCRELTKRFEESLRGSVQQMIAHFTQIEPRGEFTLVVSGATPMTEAGSAPAQEQQIDVQLLAAMERGEDMRVVVAALASTLSRPRREVYARWQQLRQQQERL